MIKVINEARGRVMDMPSGERALLIHKAVNAIPGSGSVSTNKVLDYLAKDGWDISDWDPDTFNDDWDHAWDYNYLDELGADFVDDDDDDFELSIHDSRDAYRWLQNKLSEYGNTYAFPPEDKRRLDQLIDKYGNTYFWNR